MIPHSLLKSNLSNFDFFCLQRTKNWPKIKIFKNPSVPSEMLLKGITGPNLGFLEHFYHQKVLLRDFEVLRNTCQEPILKYFFVKSGQNFILGINSSTNRGACYIPPSPLLHERKRFLEWC